MILTTARKSQTINFTIGNHFAAFVYYGDTADLSQAEIEDFALIEQEARDSAPAGFAFSHWGTDTETYDEFARCEVTGLMCACYTFTAVYFECAPTAVANSV